MAKDVDLQDIQEIIRDGTGTDRKSRTEPVGTSERTQVELAAELGVSDKTYRVYRDACQEIFGPLGQSVTHEQIAEYQRACGIKVLVDGRLVKNSDRLEKDQYRELIWKKFGYSPAPKSEPIPDNPAFEAAIVLLEPAPVVEAEIVELDAMESAETGFQGFNSQLASLKNRYIEKMRQEGRLTAAQGLEAFTQGMSEVYGQVGGKL